MGDFVMGRKRFYNLSRWLCISSLECNVNSSDHINNVYPLPHLSDVTKCRQLIIFREKILDLGPKSFCAVEMTMYVHWTCININRQDVHA